MEWGREQKNSYGGRFKLELEPVTPITLHKRMFLYPLSVLGPGGGQE